MPKKILVIDDEGLVIESLKRLLKREGYNTIIAKNGIEAMERVKEIDFDLIVTDIRMPGVDGIQIIKNIREFLAQGKKDPIPEILITGYASEESFKEAQHLQVADYIYKPFDTKEFLEIVKKNLK
ncbi:MAG: response regulator [Candidatus Omnitrophota bacterium]